MRRRRCCCEIRFVVSRISPSRSQALNNAGMACTAIGRLQEALGYLTRCVAVAPNYSDAYNNLGWLFWDIVSCRIPCAFVPVVLCVLSHVTLHCGGLGRYLSY